MKHQEKHNGIMSLIAVLGIGILSLTLSLTAAEGMLGELIKNKNAISGDQAFYTAESGVEEGTYQYIQAVLASSTYSGGTLVPLNQTASNSVSVAELDWPYVKVKGMAENDSTYRGVSRIMTVYPEGLAFDYAVYGMYGLVFGGNMTVNGSIFANNGIDFTGGSAEINGDAYSPEDIGESVGGNVNGDIIEEVEPIPPPQIDLEPYREDALAGTLSEGISTYFTSPSPAESFVNGNSRTAVVFIDSAEKTKIPGAAGTDLTGSLVTLGNLELGGGIFTATGTYAAIVVFGDLRITGGTVINGIVYVTGATSFGGGNNTINGSLISAGGTSVTDITGNATINFDPDVAANWQSLTGLDTTSTSTPVVIMWEEE